MPAVAIAAIQSTARAIITTERGLSLPEATQLKFRGTGELSPGVKVVSEAVLPVTAK
jgi:hypothetical protein